MGVPAHDERDFEFAKKYDLPIKPVIEVRGPRVFPRRVGVVVQRARPLHQFRQIRRPRFSHRRRGDRGGPRGAGPRREAGHVAASRLGHLAAALLGLPHTGHSLREVRHGAGAGRGIAGAAAGESGARRQRQSAAEGCRVSRLLVSPLRWASAARDRHHGHFRRFIVVFPALCLQRQSAGDVGLARAVLAPRRSIHRRDRARDPAFALRALLDPCGA